MSQSNAEVPQTVQNYSGTFSASGNQYLGSTFHLGHGDVHFNNQTDSDNKRWLRFIRSLRYDRIDERKNTIKENQRRTFEWALDDASTTLQNKCPLPDWFRSGQGIFLIQGKPGAGKSTLMKFLFEDERTSSLLKQSFNSENVHLLFHSFWCLGQDELQHNWKGLLCSLTSQLADLHQSSAETFSVRYSLKHSVHDWSERELYQLLFRLIETSTAAYCIFVDGLDELNHDDLDKIYDFIDKLTNLTSAKCKACLASRPMPDIESMNIASTIKIQDFTAEDIHCHVTQVLFASSRYNRRIPADLWANKTRSIADSICIKAEGVFLWVEYVLQSVRKGLRISDDLDVIEKRISALPSEIEQLYRHMLMLHQTDMDANAREVALIFSMSEYFPINAVQFAVACNSSIRTTYVRSNWLERLGGENLDNLALDFVPRLSILSAGLIECEYKRSSKGLVKFIHRTARDFLESDNTMPHLAFTTHKTSKKDILQAYVESYLVCLIGKEYPFYENVFNDLVDPIIQSEFASLNMLDTLNHVCSSLFQENDYQGLTGVPNWVAFLVCDGDELYPESTDLAGLIASSSPSTAFWNQFYQREVGRWSRYYKGYLLTLVADSYRYFQHEKLRSHLHIISCLLDTNTDMLSTQLNLWDTPLSCCRETSASLASLHLLVFILTKDELVVHDVLVDILKYLDSLKGHINMHEDLTILTEVPITRASPYGEKLIDVTSMAYICIYNARQILDMIGKAIRSCVDAEDDQPVGHQARTEIFENLRQNMMEIVCDTYIYLENDRKGSGRLIPCPESLRSLVAYAVLSDDIDPTDFETVFESLPNEGYAWVPKETRISDLVFYGRDLRDVIWTVDSTKDVTNDNWREAYTFYQRVNRNVNEWKQITF